MQKFPRTPSEILSRIDLWRQRGRPSLDTPLIAARNPTEAVLVDIWKEVLGLQEIGVDDNFFSLGGDSLHMTRIISRLMEHFDIDLSFESFFANPTIAGLAMMAAESADSDATESQNAAESLMASTATLSIESSRETYGVQNVAHSNCGVERRSIERIVIPTCGRPLALGRCLTTLGGNLLHYGRKLQILVMDGTTTTRGAHENRETVERIRRSFGFPLAIVGNNETRRLTDNLVKVGFEREVVEFGLNGQCDLHLVPIGANRNRLLLATAGERFLSSDDDTLCEFTRASGYEPMSTEVCQRDTRDDPAEIWSYSDRESLMSDIELFQVDFVRSHEELLDWSPLDPNDFRRAQPEEAEAKAFQAQQRSYQKVISVSGVLGDCGWGSPSRYLFIDDLSFERLTKSHRSYSFGLASREMLRVCRRTTVTTAADHWMSTAFAADNRSLLPPFMPLGRGEDVVFARVMKKIEPRVWFGHLPWAILHVPSETRRFWPGEVLRGAATTDLKGMFCALIDGIEDGRAEGDSQAIRNLGQALIDIADQPADDFRFLLWRYSRDAVQADLTLLENRARRFNGLGTPWEDDIRRYIDLATASWKEPSAAIPAELLGARSVADATKLSQEIVRLYGRLLLVWPEIVGIARDGKADLFR